jgi:hypothetical protein
MGLVAVNSLFKRRDFAAFLSIVCAKAGLFSVKVARKRLFPRFENPDLGHPATCGGANCSLFARFRLVAFHPSAKNAEGWDTHFFGKVEIPKT